MFAGVLGAMAQQMNMGAVPMFQITGTVPNSVPGNMQNMIFNAAQGNVSGNGSIWTIWRRFDLRMSVV